jgi:cytochrome P450
MLSAMAHLAGPRSRLLSTFRILRDPSGWFERWRARYGDPVTIPTINGTVVMTGDPAKAKWIFAHDPDDYAQFGTDAMAPLLGQRSLLVVSGATHRRDRKLLMPPFHGSRMRSYADVMAGAARRHLSRAASAGVVRARDVGQDISMEVIIRTVFGVGDELVPTFTQAVVDVVDSAGPLAFFVPALQRGIGPFSPYAKARRRLGRLDELLQSQIERVRREGGGDDILSMLVEARWDDGSAMDDAHIRDELRTLLVAGHETTALVIAWAIDAVHRNPHVLARLREELDAADGSPADDAKLPYLDAVGREALRRWPALPEVMRVLVRPLSFDGVTVPAGHSLGVAIANIHHRADIYPEPFAFRPERFLERKYGPHEYMPFGGGHRRCLGAAFAEFELRIVIGVAVREFAFELQQSSEPRAVRRNITMGPRGGVPVRVWKRQAARGRKAA